MGGGGVVFLFLVDWAKFVSTWTDSSSKRVNRNEKKIDLILFCLFRFFVDVRMETWQSWNNISAGDDIVCYNLGTGTQLDGLLHVGVNNKIHGNVNVNDIYVEMTFENKQVTSYCFFFYIFLIFNLGLKYCEINRFFTKKFVKLSKMLRNRSIFWRKICQKCCEIDRFVWRKICQKCREINRFFWRKICQKWCEIDRFVRRKICSKCREIDRFFTEKLSKIPRNQSIFWRKICQKYCEIDRFFTDKFVNNAAKSIDFFKEKFVKNAAKTIDFFAEQFVQNAAKSIDFLQINLSKMLRNQWIFLEKNLSKMLRNRSIFYRKIYQKIMENAEKSSDFDKKTIFNFWIIFEKNKNNSNVVPIWGTYSFFV